MESLGPTNHATFELMGVLDQPIASRSKKKKMRANENQDRSIGLQDVLSGPQKEDGALRPPLQPAALRQDQGQLRGGPHQEDDTRGQVSIEL